MVRKAQASVEYIMVIGFSMLLIIPIVLAFFLETQDMHDKVNLNQARKVARDIVTSAQSVYYVGEPSRTVLRANLPEKISKINITGYSFVIQIETQSGFSDIEEISTINLTGSMNASSGIHSIKIEALSDSVRITEII